MDFFDWIKNEKANCICSHFWAFLLCDGGFCRRSIHSSTEWRRFTHDEPRRRSSHPKARWARPEKRHPFFHYKISFHCAVTRFGELFKVQQNTSDGFSILSSFFQLEVLFIYYTFWTVDICIIINIYNKKWFRYVCVSFLCNIWTKLRGNIFLKTISSASTLLIFFIIIFQTDLKRQPKRLCFTQIHGLIRLLINLLSKCIEKNNKIKQTVKDQKCVYINTSRQCWTAFVWGELSESNKSVIFWPLSDMAGFRNCEPVLQKFYVEFDCCW